MHRPALLAALRRAHFPSNDAPIGTAQGRGSGQHTGGGQRSIVSCAVARHGLALAALRRVLEW
jgi:hypothetical protein